MSGKHHFTVVPNRAFFKQLYLENDQRLDILAKYLNVSAGTVSKLVRGIEVRPRVLEQIASNINQPISDLVEDVVETEIPDKNETILKLKWGWFIDNDRHQTGGPTWFREKIVWSPATARKPRQFEGKIENDFGHEFRFQGRRIGKRLFSLVAEIGGGEYAFVANFTHYFSEYKAMCGLWSGVNHVGIPAVYRMVLTAKKLSIAELQTISELYKIDAVFNANKIGIPQDNQSRKLGPAS